MAEKCVFCKIRDREIESTILFRNEYCFVIKDIAPIAPTHLLVIPIEHITNLDYINQKTQTIIAVMFKVATDMAKTEGINQSGYRLVINQGNDSGQEVPHLHLHLLGGRAMGSVA